MSNGLKLMLLTSYGQIIVIEANSAPVGQAVGDLIVGEEYHLASFVFTRLYPVNGAIAVEFHGNNGANLIRNCQKGSQNEASEELHKGLLILKNQNNTLSLTKVINLQLDPRDLHHLELRECEGVDELLLQYIQKKTPETLEVYKCKILVF